MAYHVTFSAHWVRIALDVHPYRLSATQMERVMVKMALGLINYPT